MRLSRDDEKSGESASIEHQRLILKRYVKENGGVLVDEYSDDGWSGTDFERPELKRMLADAQTGRINTVIVKDLSRFGRNYLQVGQYIDYIFPACGIRFVAVSENLDTADRNSAAMDMMPITNVFNEWHAAGTSKKIRAVLEASRRSGKYTSWNYPYGYKAGKDQNRTAVIDEEAAEVVRHIFDMRLQGFSARKIAIYLTDSKTDNPAAHYTRADGSKSARRCSPFWSPKTVMHILTDPTYIGRTTQHKTTSVSYKNHKTVKLDESEWIVRENAHPPIISRSVWEGVQSINNSLSRGRADKQCAVHPLSGFLVCPDCGKKMKLQSSGKGGFGFVCRTYKDLGKKYCASHHISEETAQKIVLKDIRDMLEKQIIDPEKAKEAFLRERPSNRIGNLYEKQLKAYRARLDEIARLVRATFEERVLNNLPENVYKDLCEGYRAEKESIDRRIDEILIKLTETPEKGDRAEEYAEKFAGYAECLSLTREMSLQLIDRISVSANCGKQREIHIYYKFSEI